MKKTALVVLAAGMGSRFGGLKQMEPFGLNGEAILDFSVNDAIEAGFSEVIFIIKKEIEKDFKETVGKRTEAKIPVKYAYQELCKIPRNYAVPAEREKPWGTGHALLCAQSLIDSPFVIINADDYYGKEGLKKLKEHLDSSEDFALAGYKLYNTLSETGKVSRGVCKVEDDYLANIDETSVDKDSGYAEDTLVSMNMWGLTPKIFEFLRPYFSEFLTEKISVPKSEFFLPTAIDRAIKEGLTKVKVYETDDKWYGVTYREDAEGVRAALQDMQKRGLYDGLLK